MHGAAGWLRHTLGKSLYLQRKVFGEFVAYHASILISSVSALP
jgi:hypothetical protein